MPSQTNRLRLLYHTLADVYRNQDYSDNWQAIDAVPGVFICTFATRPVDWTSFDDGRLIFETDTRQLWEYRHAVTDFVRVNTLGYLGGDSDTNVNIAVDSYTTVVEDEVTAAGRPLLVTIRGDITLVSVPAQLRIYDGAAALLEWDVVPARRSYTLVYNAVSAGTYDIDIGGDTAVIAWDDALADIQLALNAIPGFVGTVYDDSGDFVISYVGHQTLTVDDASLTGTVDATPNGLEHPTEILTQGIIDQPTAGAITYSFQARRAEAAGSVDFDAIQIDIVEL